MKITQMRDSSAKDIGIIYVVVALNEYRADLLEKGVVEVHETVAEAHERKEQLRREGFRAVEVRRRLLGDTQTEGRQ